MNNIKHTYTDDAVCPHCGARNYSIDGNDYFLEDDGDICEDEEIHICDECKKPFTLIVELHLERSYSFTTKAELTEEEIEELQEKERNKPIAGQLDFWGGEVSESQ